MGLSVLRSSQEMWLEEISRLIMSWKITVRVLLLCLCVCVNLAEQQYFLLLDDAQTQNGTLLFTDDATVQCVVVSVSSVSAGSTDESCLSLTLSAATTVTGLTLSPSLANICVIPVEGWFQF